MLPYYVLEKTESCKQFFYSHIGLYNFWNQYLVLNLGYNVYCVIVNIPHTKFNGSATLEQNQHFQAIIQEYFKTGFPEEVIFVGDTYENNNE